MRKITGSFLCLGLALVLSGCGAGGSGSRNASKAPGVNDVLEERMAEESGEQTSSENASSEADASAGTDASGSELAGTDDSRQTGLDTTADTPAPEDEDELEAARNSEEGIDLDLTKLSSTMVYSEVYSMLADPTKFVGQIIKMNGTSASYHDKATDTSYFACIIQDATACCSQGIEYALTEDYKCPEDYPKDGKEVTVVGEFTTYIEGEYTYVTLRDAKLVK